MKSILSDLQEALQARQIFNNFVMQEEYKSKHKAYINKERRER